MARSPHIVPLPGDSATAPRTNAVGRLDRRSGPVRLVVARFSDRGLIVREEDGTEHDMTHGEWRTWAVWPRTWETIDPNSWSTEPPPLQEVPAEQLAMGFTS